jgi:hypothetical protein
MQPLLVYLLTSFSWYKGLLDFSKTLINFIGAKFSSAIIADYMLHCGKWEQSSFE